MFCEFTGPVRRTPVICIVAPGHEREFLRTETHYWHGRGWRVHVLACPSLSPGTLPGAELTNLADVTQGQAPRELHNFAGMDIRAQVHVALTELHRLHSFNLIEFIDSGGLGFRAMQAKRVGLAFADVPLLVHLSGPAGKQRRDREQWLQNPADLANDFCERYAWEHADGHCIRDAAAAADLAGLGWTNRTPTAAARKSGQPLVTVSVAYFNLAPFLEDALASLAAQTYPALEVLVINDGSTDLDSSRVFQKMRSRYPGFRFFQQKNAGIGATRNRGLAWARGDFFLPMDADNIARPDMIARLVAGLQRNPDLAALSCYFLAFTENADLTENRFRYCYQPLGGPYVLGCQRNIFGDGNTLFRKDALRAIGGFNTDRDTSFEDWEVFVKLLNAGHALDVVPDYLFYYRHREEGFSRATSGYRNHQRVLRQYVEGKPLDRAERLALWQNLAGLQRRVETLENRNRALRTQLRSLRYQLADKVQNLMKQVPFVHSAVKWLVKNGSKVA